MKGILVSVLFVILTCHGTRADELLLSPNLNESSRTLIPCGDNSDCESYQDGLCQDGFCECNGTRFCEDKVETVVTKIGEFCKVDADCNIEHSVCKDDKCACEEGRVDSSDGRKCLMNSDQPCIGSSSCNGFDSEKYPSKCIPGKCECEEERPYCSNGIKFGFHEGGAKKIIDGKNFKSENPKVEKIIETVVEFIVIVVAFLPLILFVPLGYYAGDEIALLRSRIIPIIAHIIILLEILTSNVSDNIKMLFLHASIITYLGFGLVVVLKLFGYRINM